MNGQGGECWTLYFIMLICHVNITGIVKAIKHTCICCIYCSLQGRRQVGAWGC